MSDPLKLIQEYTTGKRQMKEVVKDNQTYYAFGDFAFPEDATTSIRMYNKQTEYYTIKAILFFWEKRDVTHSVYVRDCGGHQVQAVTRMQRMEIASYLKGERDTVDLVDPFAHIPAPIPTSRLLSSTTAEPQPKRPRLDHEDKGQRIDKILDQSTHETEPEVRGLSNELSAEKVAQLRTRVKKNLKHIVKPIGEEGFPTAATMEAMDTSVDADSDGVGKHLKSKERLWKNRTTCLEAQSKDFSNVLAILHNLKSKEAVNRSRPPPPPSNGAPNGTNSQQRRSATNVQSGYSRYDQEMFQTQPVADFQIETGLSFHGTSFNAIRNISTAGGTPAGAPPGAAGTSRTPTTTNPPPSAPAGRYPSSAPAPIPRSAPSTPGTAQTPNGRPQKRVSTTPIIVIPASGTALITMFNAMDILQDLTYVSSEEKKKTMRRENEILIQRRKDGRTVPYRVVDNPLKLRDDEWERVVAVFVQGPAWQFKGWRWNGNPTEIFSHLAAFHLKFEEQKLDPHVAKWSVHVLSLSKTKRHLDKATLHQFWAVLDRHIAKTKPHLRY